MAKNLLLLHNLRLWQRWGGMAAGGGCQTFQFPLYCPMACTSPFHLRLLVSFEVALFLKLRRPECQHSSIIWPPRKGFWILQPPESKIPPFFFEAFSFRSFICFLNILIVDPSFPLHFTQSLFHKVDLAVYFSGWDVKLI